MIVTQKNSLVVALLAVFLCSISFAATYDESIDGDISNLINDPTVFDLDCGEGVPVSNLVTGTVGGIFTDLIDALAVTIDEGCSLGIFLNDYSGDGTTFVNIFDDGGENVGAGSIGVDNIGTDILAELVPDINPGEYTVQLNLLEFTTGQGYQLDYQCACPVPEPSAIVLVGMLVVPFLAIRKRRS